MATGYNRGVDLPDRALFYERFASEFDDKMNRYEVSKRLRLVFDEALGGVDLTGRALLDAGCGTGLFSECACSRGAEVTSMDVGEALLERVAEKCESTRVVGDVTRLPFAAQSFDVVINTEVIEHTLDPRRAVGELARVLRPGGTLILTTPNHVWHWSIELASRLRIRPYQGVENWVRWRELQDWLRDDGLTIEDFRGFNALPFLHPALYGANDRLDRFGHGPLGRYMINMIAVANKSSQA
ncbi:MAG: class I SAM-dependent methyltransferase [Solirubrobacterales bacterium]